MADADSWVSFLNFLSSAFGWIYTISWSLSFYPQPILNWRRKSTSGTTIDFPLVNVLGFIAYMVSNAAFLYSPVIRHQYALRNKGLTPTVQFNDLAFAAHATLLSVLTFSQFWPRLWGFEKHGRDELGVRISKSILGIFFGCISGVVITIFIVVANMAENSRKGWAWIDVIYAISYVKLLITLIKYTPQIITNYRNRSTKGWSIEQILFDFLGGILSLAQLGIDSYLQHDWSGVTGNPVKFALGNFAIIFDLIFMLQHYCLYSDKNKPYEDEQDEDGEVDPLLR